MRNFMAVFGLACLICNSAAFAAGNIGPAAVGAGAGTAVSTVGISAQEVAVASAVAAAMKVSTATLDFSGVDEKDKPVVSGYIQAVFDYFKGENKPVKPAPDASGLKPVSFTDRQQFAAMRALASTMTDDEFHTSNWATPHLLQLFALSSVYQTWVGICKATHGNEKCVTEKILPAFKNIKDNKIRHLLVTSIGQVRLDQASEGGKKFSDKSIRLIADVMRPEMEDKSNPLFLRKAIGNTWAQSLFDWYTVKKGLEYLETDPEMFSTVSGEFYVWFDYYKMPQIAEIMYGILGNPRKYPSGVVRGAFGFVCSDSWRFKGDKNGERRDRTKKILKALGDDEDKDGSILKAVGKSSNSAGNKAHGLLLEIEDDEKDGKYK